MQVPEEHHDALLLMHCPRLFAGVMFRIIALGASLLDAYAHARQLLPPRTPDTNRTQTQTRREWCYHICVGAHT